MKSKILNTPHLRSKLLDFSIKQIQGSDIASQVAASRTGSADLCPLCVNLLDQTINQLANIIINAGVLGGCSDVCGYLEKVSVDLLTESIQL